MQGLEDDNRRLKSRVNKLIDEIKGCKEELEKKKREVANLKRIAAARKQDAATAQTSVIGKKRPAAPDQSDILVGQGPTYRADDVDTGPIHLDTKGGHDNIDQLALLNTYKARYVYYNVVELVAKI